MKQREWVTLADYIDTLLKDGKRGDHIDFKPLFSVFGKDRVVRIAKEILAKEKKENQKV